jgi:hypothetical protein
MQQYLLHPHVHMCVTDDHAVLLDLRQDKYIGIGPGQMDVLAASIKGWPGAGALISIKAKGPPAIPAPGGGEGPLSKMIASGMLTTDPTIGKEARPPLLPRPEATLTEPDLEARPRPTAGQITHFLTASLTARTILRRRPIHSVVERAKTRKDRHSPAGGESQGALQSTRNLVDAFLYLRPLLFDAKDECLYDSFALIEYLARYDVFPTWVFGVQTRPFKAHSWVQHGDLVFNDTPEYVRHFTPILTV